MDAQELVTAHYLPIAIVGEKQKEKRDVCGQLAQL